MTAAVKVKICGLRRACEVQAAQNAGADYVGFVFYPPSHRHLTIAAARHLVEQVEIKTQTVALSVDSSNAELEKIIVSIQPDWLQLHGSETPSRVAEIKSTFALPVIKACGIKTKTDIYQLNEYFDVANQLLIDAKPIDRQEGLPGGNGVAFDWQLIAGYDWKLPWLLAGGLNAQNVREAIKLTAAKQVDVSSGVETSTGQKSVNAITEFILAAKGNINVTPV